MVKKEKLLQQQLVGLICDDKEYKDLKHLTEEALKDYKTTFLKLCEIYILKDWEWVEKFL